MDHDTNAGRPNAADGSGANFLIRLLTTTNAAWLEPLKIRRVAAAQADARRLLTQAEIDREKSLADARYRLEAMELRRQKNLEGIAAALRRQSPAQRWAIHDEDWLAEFVEACKDTSNPTIQDIWARLLAGEMETPGRCSKRTLRLVKGLALDEARLIQETCARVCHRVERDAHMTAFLNVLVTRYEAAILEETADIIALLDESTPEIRRRNDRLIACGFLSNDDFKFSIYGEGHLDPKRFHLSGHSPAKIILGAKALVLEHPQPGLLYKSRTIRREQPHIHTPAASIEFDGWKLTPEGVELYRALNTAPDYTFLAALHESLLEGGLTVTLTEASPL